jgi:hypothetical protein
LRPDDKKGFNPQQLSPEINQNGEATKMSRTASQQKAIERRLAIGDDKFRNLLAVTSMIQYCQAEVQAVSPTAAILLSNSKQVLLAEMEQELKSALGKRAA